MLPLIRNGILSLDLLSKLLIIKVVLIVDKRVVFETKVLLKRFSTSPVRKGLSMSGPIIIPIPNIKCDRCRTGALFFCHISVSQTVFALFQAPLLTPINQNQKNSVHMFVEYGIKMFDIPINNIRIIDVI